MEFSFSSCSDDDDDDDDDDAIEPFFILPSKFLVFLSGGYSQADEITLVRKVIKNAMFNNSVARVLVSSRKITLLTSPCSWNEELSEDGWFSDNTEFVPLHLFQNCIKFDKYANTKQLVVFTAPQNIVSMVETGFFTHVILDEEAHELKDLLKMTKTVNLNFTYILGSASFQLEDIYFFSMSEQVDDLKFEYWCEQLQVVSHTKICEKILY